MPISFRRVLGTLALLTTAALTLMPAAAQDKFPSRPVTLINPLAVGGGVDLALRALAQELQPILGQPVVVESRPGAGGTIAGEHVARAVPDGHVMGLFQSTQAIPEMYAAFQKPPYTSADLRPVVRYMSLTYAMPSRAGAPWKTLPEFIAYAKQHPDKVSWGRTVGLGHPLHLLFHALIQNNELKLIEIPYKGAGDAITSLLGGHVDVAFGLSVTSIESHVRSGKMSILAIHHPERLPELPDVPTFKEQGADPGVVPVYNTFFVPKATPDAAVKRLHDAVKAAMETPALKQFAQKNGFELYYGSERDIIKELQRDREVSAALVEAVAKQQN